jgi:hypothetical protein
MNLLFEIMQTLLKGDMLRGVELFGEVATQELQGYTHPVERIGDLMGQLSSRGSNGRQTLLFTQLVLYPVAFSYGDLQLGIGFLQGSRPFLDSVFQLLTRAAQGLFGVFAQYGHFQMDVNPGQ